MGELWGVYSVKIYCIFNVIARYIVSEMKQNVSSDRTYLWFQFQRWYSVEFPIMDFIILKQAPVSSVCIVVWGNGYFALNGCPVDILSKVFWLAFIWCCWRLTETEELNMIFCNVCSRVLCQQCHHILKVHWKLPHRHSIMDQILWKFYFALNQILDRGLLKNFAHDSCSFNSLLPGDNLDLCQHFFM